MRLTKTTGHAIRILIDCAGAGEERVKVASIAGRLGISQLNAFKIVHILAKAGFLDAMRGRNGGVMLAMPPATIRIGSIVREIEATEIAVAGANGAKKKDKAPVNEIFDDALNAFIGVLDRHTLADISPVVKRNKGKPAGKSAGKSAKPRTVLDKSFAKGGKSKASLAKTVAKKALSKTTTRRPGARY